MCYIARRDNEGAVITAPRNFTSKNVKKGKTDDVLFSKPGYVSTGKYFINDNKSLGDPFIDAGK